MIGSLLVTQAGSPALSNEEVKDHLRIEHDADDLLIDQLVAVAAERFERETNRALVETTYQWEIPRFPFGREPITLPRSPLIAVESIEYYKPGETSLTTVQASTYSAWTAIEPPEIRLAEGASWPNERTDPWPAVRVTFRAGYETAEAVPALAKQAMKMLIGGLYDVREEVSAGGPRTREAPSELAWRAMIQPLRIVRFA